MGRCISGRSPWKCISLDVASLFQLGQSCTTGNIVILQQFSRGDRENNCCYIFLFVSLFSMRVSLPCVLGVESKFCTSCILSNVDFGFVTSH